MRKLSLMIAALLCAMSALADGGPQVTYRDGTVEGVDSSGVCIFRGIPFAKAPVGSLRWRAPQPVEPWTGVRQAKRFGPDPLQRNVYGDMVFEAGRQSEDCLYLNIWTPAKKADAKLPVLIYFNGGGLVAGSGSEPRYQGLRLARRGNIIVVTANYREGILGFFSSKELTKEGCHGNQGWLDQAAAIQWVKDNIAAFGGDPNHIVINGESAGSQSVCAQTVSPLSRHLLAGYICSSGSVVSNAAPISLEASEAITADWMKKNKVKSLKQLMAVPAEELLKLDDGRFGEGTKCIDGVFLTESPDATIQKGEQAQVPCLLGNNNGEAPIAAFARKNKPTREGLAVFVKNVFGADPNVIYRLYDINSDEDLIGAKGDVLGGDMFIAYATWKWADMVRQTSTAPVYRYVYCHPRPILQIKGKASGLAGGTVDVADDAPKAPESTTAVHSADIEYAMGNLSTAKGYPWKPCCFATSEIFQQIYINFVKFLNPNGPGVPAWEAYNKSKTGVPAEMLIDEDTHQVKDAKVYARYQAIDGFIQKKK